MLWLGRNGPPLLSWDLMLKQHVVYQLVMVYPQLDEQKHSVIKLIYLTD